MIPLARASQALAIALCVAIGLAGACGGGKGSTDGGGGTSGSAGDTGAAGRGGAGGAGGSGGNAACASAVATQACSSEGTVCGGESCTDQCQFCNLLRCMNGVWQSMEVAPYPCFACGPDRMCRRGIDYCVVTRGGPPPGSTSYACTGMPTPCTQTPTCACLQSQGALSGGGTCSQAGAGELTVTFDLP